MTGKRKPNRNDARGKRPAGKGPKAGPPRSGSAVQVRKSADGQAWEFVPPRCARDRAEDLEEVRKMIVADEIDIAIDELRWLLNGCSDFVDAHRLLGELALAEEDLPLARGHFGYAHQIGIKALANAPHDAKLPYKLPANQAFHEAGRGLVYCLLKLDKREMAVDIVEQLVRRDPNDPLEVRKLLEQS